MQQFDATAAGSGEPPLQVGAPPVEADIASLPAAASKFGLPPPPNLSSLGSAAATSTQANAPAEAPDQPSLAGLSPPALGVPAPGSRSAPGPSSGPPPGPTAPAAGPPSGSSGYARRGGQNNSAAVLQGSRCKCLDYHARLSRALL